MSVLSGPEIQKKKQANYTHNTAHNSKNLEDFKQKIYLRTFTLQIFNALKSRLTSTTLGIDTDNRKLLS